MINLVNIKRGNNVLSADYYYSDENDRGSLSVDEKTGKLIDFRYNNFDEEFDGSYLFKKVVNFLRQGIGSDKTPEKCTMMWY